MLQKPFTGNYLITQGFGENANGFYHAEGLLGHQGIDWNLPTGTPVLSPCDGQVIFTSTDIQKGEGVTVLSDAKFKFQGQDCFLSCVMWHLQDGSIKVKVGDHVSVGQLLALSNNTGQTTGPHLHFSVAPLSTDGGRRLLASINNGFKGCVNPLPYLDSTVVNFTHSWSLPVQRVKDFQAKNGLVPDGIVGKLTQAKIDQLI